LEDPLAEDIIGGRFKPGSAVKVVKKGDRFVFE